MTLIPQKPITDYKEIAKRIMNHIWRDWDENSPAHNHWKRYAKKNFKSLKKKQWREIYKIADNWMKEN